MKNIVFDDKKQRKNMCACDGLYLSKPLYRNAPKCVLLRLTSRSHAYDYDNSLIFFSFISKIFRLYSAYRLSRLLVNKNWKKIVFVSQFTRKFVKIYQPIFICLFFRMPSVIIGPGFLSNYTHFYVDQRRHAR